jgi:hypothetical protein
MAKSLDGTTFVSVSVEEQPSFEDEVDPASFPWTDWRLRCAAVRGHGEVWEERIYPLRGDEPVGPRDEPDRGSPMKPTNRPSRSIEGLDRLERAVIEMLLSGDHPVLVALREQARSCRATTRERTGAGFYCHFQVPREAALSLTKRDFRIGDVVADIQGLEHGAGFVLFIRNGCLDLLEGYSFDEPWPARTAEFKLSFQAAPRVLDELPELIVGPGTGSRT